MKSVFSLSFEGVKDVFGSLFLIKEKGERGIGIFKRCPPLAFLRY